jgi:hypothetical protein
MRIHPLILLAGACVAASTLSPALALAENVHFTYLWHLEQPIYWPDRQTSGTDRYEHAWQSILRRDAGAAHPSNNLRDIFGLDDRRAVYQYRVKDTINDLRWTAEAGAQISYSGGLIHNINSLGSANQLGYASNWAQNFRDARNWYTSKPNAKPRLDIVNFSFHHALLPLLEESTIRREIQVYKAAYAPTWGSTPAISKGFFPSEMAFNTRMIPISASEGIEWSIVSAEKLSRACADFPVILGSGGINCDPPNKADQLNPAAGFYFRQSIDRGCSPAEAAPFSLMPHRAQYVNPSTGSVSSIIVVPASMSLSWKDGYAPMGTGYFSTLNSHNTGARPILVVLAHDGDNAWGGGFSYYREATPNLVSSAVSQGYIPTVIEQYLADHPVPSNAIVHVEQGAWVNADGDFGSPQMLNWNWPPVNADGSINILGGWAEDIRNWAIITANQNRIDTAEQIWLTQGGQAVRPDKIFNPDAATTSIERAWHYFLGGLNSGYMYYGTAEDFEVKPTIAGNRALEFANPIINAAPHLDQTGPTIWHPQRFPWNPGSLNFGPMYGYQQFQAPVDFDVYTFVSDVSGLASVTLKYRVDVDGANPLNNNDNETYAGGAGVGAWQSVTMTQRAFPAGNVLNSPTIDFFVLPQVIADQYTGRIVGQSNKLLDYYIEAVDTRGNIKRSTIEHVWVGDGSGSSGGGGNDPAVVISPESPTAGEQVTITYNPSGRNLASANPVSMHWGVNNWATVFTPPYVTMSPAGANWQTTITLPQNATQLDVVFNNSPGGANGGSASTWDNNNGSDWHFAVQPGNGDPPAQWVMDGVLDQAATLIQTNTGLSLWAGLIGDVLYVATNDAGEGNDHFILLARDANPLAPAMWAKAGQVADWDAFLADENSNDYEGWFDATGATQAMTGANGGVLEGTINLAQEFGTRPSSIRLAVALFGNADGGSLLNTHQIAPSVNSDGNVDASEYVVVDLCALAGNCCIADFDHNGGVDGGDLAAFFTAFEIGDPSADVDSNGGVDGGDLAYFFTRFEAGC